MKKGFTLIELMVVMGIIGVLIGVTTMNLTGFQSRTYLDTTVSLMIEDIKQQQLKAMTGDTEGRGTNSPYGIKFETNRYVLFSGSVYNPNDSSNFAINIENNIRITGTTFHSAVIVFQKGSGEVANFVNGSNTITVENINTNEQKVIHINKYGTITNVN